MFTQAPAVSLAFVSGPFKISEVLGEGAFGAVFVARVVDDPLQRKIALKVLKAEYSTNPKVLNRARDEARLLSRIQHPSIVRVERLVDLDDRPALVMELVHGVSLKRLLDRYPEGLPVAVALQVIRQTCIALHVAYHEGFGDDKRPLRVIHRDIKPSNMLLSVHGELKVVDFGIATGQFAERESETESLVMGSRPYMAPERLDGATDTPAVDIYSAGMSLFELLAGKPLNLSINPGSHQRTLTEGLDRLNLRGLPADASEDLRQLMRRMCSYEEDFRPSARDAATALGSILEKMGGGELLSLPDFARDVVVPLYNARPRYPVDSRHEMFGLVQRESTPTMSRQVTKRPVLFLSALLVLVLVLASLSLAKARRARTENRVQREAATLASVMVWIPSEVTARVGTSMLAAPGVLRLPPGPAELDLTDGNTVLTCPFDVRDGIAIRYVVDAGRPSISINDGPAVACHPAESH